MSDLAAFLAARLGEDWVHAWAVHDVSKCDALLYEDLPATEPLPDAGDCECGYPARALREVAAKRVILADYQEAAQSPYDLPEGVREGRDEDERERDAYLIDVLEDVLRHLAAAYSLAAPRMTRRGFAQPGPGRVRSRASSRRWRASAERSSMVSTGVSEFVGQYLGVGEMDAVLHPEGALPRFGRAPDVGYWAHVVLLGARKAPPHMEGAIAHRPPLPLAGIPDPGELA